LSLAVEVLFLTRLTDDLRTSVVASVASLIGPGWWDNDPAPPPVTVEERMAWIAGAGGEVA
jgi:hypothetical protein